jgi:hydrogenase 3 maturation protease
MSGRSWQSLPARTMTLANTPAPFPRVAIVGLGHELRGDDGAGIALARALQSVLPDEERLLVIDAGPAPENYTGPLRRFAPQLVLLVDAADMDRPPGTIGWASWQNLEGLGAFTHSLSPRVLASYLIAELGCEVRVVGIQPAQDAVTTELSPEVAEAVDTVLLSLLRVFAGDWSLCLHGDGPANAAAVEVSPGIRRN